MAQRLFRGLPATGGIQDVAVRRVVDGIIQNLRSANLAVSATGAVYSGTEASEQTFALQQGGGGARVGIDFSNARLRLRTLAGSGAVTVEEDGQLVVVGLDPESTVADTYKVKSNAGGTDTTPDYLSAKLQNAGGSGEVLLRYDTGVATAKVVAKRLIDGVGIVLTPDTDNITVTLALISSGEDPDVELMRADEYGQVYILRLKEGTGVSLESDGDVVEVAVPDIGKVMLDEEDETLGYLGEKFTEYAVALDSAGEVANCQAVVWDGGLSIVALLQLGDAAVRNQGTGAEDVAAGNHSHAAGDVLPEGTDGDVLYYAAGYPSGSWVASNLADLVADIVADLFTGLSDVTLEAGTHKVLVKPGLGDEVMGWAALEDDCDA